ncbi:MAG: hypothetical protein C4543_01335 [Ignavibacteriales bacterium]|jgi:O-antigen/teichoic acid export membrane protein|nr:MAG: hypothetical protein C4543_01335 [Ignavibacteriales bacterium]
MIDKIKKTVKQTAIYSLGGLSTKLIGLILLPLYTSHLSTSEYGILSIIEITSQILMGFFTLHFSEAMMRWIATEKSPFKHKTIVFTSLFSLVIISSLLLISFYPLTDYFSQVIFGSLQYKYYLELVLIWSALGIIFNIPFSLLRIQEKAVFFVLITASKFTLILFANIYFIVGLNLGVEGIIYSQIIGEIFSLLITTPFIIKNIHLKFDFTLFKDMFKYGLPMAFSAVAALLLSFGDRYILNYFLPLSSVGIYSLGFKLSSIINVFLLQSFQLGFVPIAFKMFDQENSQRFFSKVLTYFTFILAIAVLSISFFGKEIIFLFANQEYHEAYTVIPLIAFAFLIKGINLIFILGFQYSKKTSRYAIIIFAGLVLTIGVNILLIPIIGIYGAGVSMLVSYIFMAVASYLYSQKLFFVKYEIAKVTGMTVLSAALYLTSILIPFANIYLETVTKLILLISFPYILYFFNFYEEIELLRIKQSWLKWRNPKRWKDNFRQIKF